MKKVLSLLLCLAMLVSMTACINNGNVGNDSGYNDIDSSHKASLTFKHIWPEHEETMKNLIANFNKKFPNITITPSVTPYDQVEQVLQAAYISGDLPNVYVFYTHYMTPMVSATDGVMAGTLNTLRDDIVDDFTQTNSWEMGRINGNYYSAPFRATGVLVFYNKTLFGEKGWTKPNTFQEFEALLKNISQNSNLTPFAVGGKESQIAYLINAMSLFTGVLDGSVEEPGYAVGRLAPDDPNTDDTAVLIYEKIQKWYAADFLGKGAIAVSNTGAITEFTSRRAAMVFANPNNMGDISALMPNDEIGVFAIPAPAAIADTVKYVYGGYDGLSYNPGASEAQIKASVQFIKYMVSTEAQQLLVDRTQSIVVNKNVTYRSTMQQNFADEMKYVGAYSTGTDYVTGTHSADNLNVISKYIAGLSTLTAKQVIKQINDNVYADMQDPLINDPVVDWYPRQNPKKTYDRTWLNTNLEG